MIGQARGALLILLLFLGLVRSQAAGVTLITHGFLGNIEDWIMPMAEAMHADLGTNYVCYEVQVEYSFGSFTITKSKLGGSDVFSSSTGEIFVKLDWSSEASLFGESASIIGEGAALALLSTNLFAELRGHSLAELPIHLVGHSRGSSVITAISRILGEHGIWIDHLTMLDPHPVASFGDEPAVIYRNVFFADNYWQDLGDGLITPNGQFIAGAFNRKLVNLSGGYSSPHSDAHLFYHGTIDLTTPTTDTQANISNLERSSWYASAEAQGAQTGYAFSRLRDGDRFSSTEPAGIGTGMIKNGVNQFWNFGAGLMNNRTALPVNNGTWPNILQISVDQAQVLTNEPIQITPVFQYGAPGSTALITIFADLDLNPWNSNEVELATATVNSTGTQVFKRPFDIDSAILQAGAYTFLAEIRSGAYRRFLYGSDFLRIAGHPIIENPVVQGARLLFNVRGTPGSEIILYGSTELRTWEPLTTNVLTSAVTTFRDARELNEIQFYRAALNR